MTQQRFGNYRVVRQLGEGGMGVVYEALHEEIGKRAAIKVLHAAFSKDAQVSARFLTEARAVNLVTHPGLVSIFEFGRTPDGAAFLVMEFLEGDTLRARLNRLTRLAVPDARRIARQIASALAAAHDKNVVHRDLKPENVMLIPEPELPGGERAKVLDFGVAKIAQGTFGAAGAGATQAGTFLGTPAYMAPEQCLSAANVDDRADVYALGIMLFEMLTGSLPFLSEGLGEMMLMHIQKQPQPVRELAPEVPEDLAALVAQMLAKEPNRRPSARDIARTIEGPSVTAASVAAIVASSMPSFSSVPPVSPNLSVTGGVTVSAVAPASGMFPSGPPSIPTAAQLPAVRPALVHRGRPETTLNNYVFLDHPLMNNDPFAQLLITPNWNPGGQGGVANNHHTGVWYASNGRWSIYNEDRLAMPTTAAFNVLVCDPKDTRGKSAFIHRATPGNIVNNWTVLDHPSCNNRPDALLLVTANWNPGGQGGTYNNHALGVWYTNGRWAIYNQDRAPMPQAAAFNVLVAEQTFLHRAAPGNLVGANASFIENPAARNNPDAVVIVTSNWNPGGQGGLYHDHAIGVYYYGDRWAVFNQDNAPMTPGAAFNIWIAPS